MSTTENSTKSTIDSQVALKLPVAAKDSTMESTAKLSIQTTSNIDKSADSDDPTPEFSSIQSTASNNIDKSTDPTTALKPIFTPRTALANSVTNFTAKRSEVENVFHSYRALVPNCVVDKYIKECTRYPNKTVEISAYAESYWGAVLFADISGFSKLAEKLQQELGEGAKAAETLSRYVGKSLDIMVKLITSNRGDVIKFAGDAILAVFPSASFSDDNSQATLRCAQVGLELADLELIAGPQRLSVHCGMGCGDLIGYHVGGVYNRWEYAVTGDPIEQIGSSEPEAEAGQLVLAGPCIPWLIRGLIQKMPKSLRTMMSKKFEEKELARLKGATADQQADTSNASGRSTANSIPNPECSKDFPFQGVLNPSSGNFLLTSIDIGMTSLTATTEMEKRDKLRASNPELFRGVLSRALPVLRNYIPRPVLIALDAGQSVW
jgi:hypothetical protein